jgi:diguanylate cyclase (GGDEF)-like protein
MHKLAPVVQFTQNARSIESSPALPAPQRTARADTRQASAPLPVKKKASHNPGRAGSGGGAHSRKPRTTAASGASRNGADHEQRLRILNDRLKQKNAELRTLEARLRASEILAQDAGDALQASLDREKLTLAFAEIGTCEFDVRSRMIRVSEMSLRLLGFRSGEPDVPYDRYLSSIHPEDRPRFDQVLLQCLDGTGSLDIEYRVALIDGSYRWLRTKGDALLNLDGDPIKVLWVTEDVSQRKDMDARVRFLAHHDLLTGLPNRTLFQDRLQQALAAAKRMQTRVALLFVDLDRFKAINDSFGHKAGDTVLQAVAARLRRCVRETDTVCRHSGDEYLIALSALRDPAEGALVADKILQVFGKPFSIDGNELTLSASIGISVYPDDGHTIEDLVRNADAAMYHSKRNGRNRFEFFTPELTAPATERLMLANQLRRSIERDELVLHYQPKFDTASNRLIGAEALVRWNHPERGLMMPERFISIAEESDVIHLVGEWVLNQACRQAGEWKAAGVRPVPIAINFSAFQFRRSDLIETVAGALTRHAMEPRLLEIELTENAIMQDPRETAKILDTLSAMGVALSIDDFGTGYSSLSYLKRFAIHKLKIDRSFVTDLPDDLNDAAIVQAIVNLAKSLQLDVIAEGVETPAQLEFLRGIGCGAYQGYLGGRPVEAARFAKLLG